MTISMMAFFVVVQYKKKKKKIINTIAGAILGENFLLAKIYSIDGNKLTLFGGLMIWTKTLTTKVNPQNIYYFLKYMYSTFCAIVYQPPVNYTYVLVL